MEKMRRWRYAVAIVVGLIFGAVFALDSGNNLTGVLGGILIATFVSWGLALKWDLVGLLAKETSSQIRSLPTTVDSALGFLTKTGHDYVAEIRNPKNNTANTVWAVGKPIFIPVLILLTLALVLGVIMPVVAVLLVIAGLALVIGTLGWCFYKLVIRPMWRIPYLVVTRPGIRKGLYYTIALSVFGFVIAFSISHWITSPAINSIVTVDIFLALSICLMALAVISAICVELLAIIFFCKLYCLSVIKENEDYPAECIAVGESQADIQFFTEWYWDGMYDSRSPLHSVLYMLTIRIANVFYPFVWSLLFVFWLPTALSGRKTILTTMCSAALTGTYLSISYVNGWINVANTNFWLCLGVAIVAGIGLGLKIAKLKSTDSHRPFPRYRRFVHSKA